MQKVTNHNQAEIFMLQLSKAENDLPVAPELLGNLFQQTSEESRFSLDQIALTITKDQGLAARILSRANSAYYGLQGQISSISRAVNLLGLAELRKILLFVTASSLSKKAQPDILDLKAYWQHQCFVAALSAEMAVLCGREDSQDLFISGILHDLGKLMIALYQPQIFVQISELAVQNNLSRFEAELEFWGIDHALTGAMVLRSWNIPETITEAINAHHDAEKSDEQFRDQARILSLANIISHNRENDFFPESSDNFDMLGLNVNNTLQTARNLSSDPSLSELRALLH